MVEFYYTYFPKNYKQKISHMIIDIKKLCEIEGITFLENYKLILDKKYSSGLDQETWNELNKIFYTLNLRKSSLSKTLIKFINKNNIIKSHCFVDLFSGCGGLSLGLENAGFNPIFVNEIEKNYLETYYFNRDLPLSNYFGGDINELISNFERYKEYFKNLDLVVGGPPCQGFSIANQQRIIDDPRNILYKSFLKILELSKPKFFVMENVKGMLNKSKEIIEDINAALGDSYSIEIILLNAKDFGIPQNRQRVFIIGSSLKSVPATKIIEEIKKNKNLVDYKLKHALEGLPILESNSIKNNSKAENNKHGYKIREFSYNLTEFERFINKNKINYLFNHVNRYNNQRDVEIYSKLPEGANSLHDSIKDIMPYKSRSEIFKDKYYKLDGERVCKTITSHMRYDCNMYIHPYQPRGLSPREAARVQSFPDDFVFLGSRNNWYSQIGNAVPVKLAEVIGKSIFKFV